jgi:succinyl-diaminopimelate desuccinylase
MTSNDRLTQLLCDLIALPSVNPEREVARAQAPYGERRVADFVLNHFQSLGLAVERHEVLPGRENVLVFLPGSDSSLEPVLLEAHMDTVDVQGMDSPFTPSIKQERVYGRGACDTKGSLAVMIHTVSELAAGDVVPRRGCVLAATADEEYGMRGAQRLVLDGKAFCAAIVGEPTGLRLVSAHDGQMYVRIAAHGKAAHTSNPQNGVNAIYIIKDLVDVLLRRSSAEYCEREHSLCGPPKVTVSMVQGGISEHIVPDYCEITIDCRVIPGETCDRVLEEIKGWADQGLTLADRQRITFAEPHKMEPPMETPTDHPLVQGLRDAAYQVLGRAEVVGVAYNTNASHYAAAGIPCVVFGPGSIAQAHSVEEYVEIEQLHAAAQILRRFLLDGAAALG